MRSALAIAVAATMVAFAPAAVAQHQGQHFVTPKDIKWGSTPSLPGAKFAVLNGPMNEAVPFTARIQFLETKDRVTAVATPMLLVANNEVARLFVGEERPVVRNISSQTTVNENVVTTTPSNTIETRPVGTTLLLTPNVNADRTVTLRVLEESSEVLVGEASIPVVTGDGDVINQPVDVVSSRTVTGTSFSKIIGIGP